VPTRRGIERNGAGSTSKIDNEGTFKRAVAPSVAGQHLVIKPPVTNTAATAKVILGKDTAIHFVNGVNVKKGKYEKDPSAKVKGDEVVGVDGTLTILTAGLAPGHYDNYSEGTVDVAGTFEIESTPGVFVTVHVTGRLIVAFDAHVKVNVDGTTQGNSDQFLVSGTMETEGAWLDVTTQGGPPEVGWGYGIFYATDMQFLGLQGASGYDVVDDTPWITIYVPEV
jgi:hypothetical protein